LQSLGGGRLPAALRAAEAHQNGTVFPLELLPDRGRELTVAQVETALSVGENEPVIHVVLLRNLWLILSTSRAK